MSNEDIERIEDDVIYIMSCPTCDTAFKTMGSDVSIYTDEDDEGNIKKYMQATHQRCGNSVKSRIK